MSTLTGMTMATTNANLRLVLGGGFLGRRVARRWREAGGRGFVLTRSQDHAAALEAEGFEPIVGDVTRPETLAGLPCAATVLYAIGYDRHAAASREAVHLDGLRAVLAALPPETGKLLYTSSTSVYGPAGGGPVDEDSPCRPNRDAGRIMLAAEQLLAAHPLGARALILRMAGLYGPGRIPRMNDLLAGKPLPVAAGGHLNLIHVDDAATAILAAEVFAQPPRTFIVADGHPTDRREFYLRLAELLPLPPPRFIEPLADDPATLRVAADKQTSNARLLKELRLTLAYPTYREGLVSVVEGG
jgi:nucleoside-diphosphate-sugar epimerase